MSFSHIIETIIGSADSTVITLNPYEINFLKRVVSTEPDIINNIVADNKITISDIPKIILIMANVYRKKLISTDININIINVVDFTIGALIDTIPMPEEERTVFNEILNYCIELLKTNIPFIEKEERNVYDCTRRFFINMYNGIVHLFHRNQNEKTVPQSNAFILEKK